VGLPCVQTRPLPETRPRLDQAHHALDRHWFARTGLHQPGGNPQACVTGLAPLHTLGRYQRRAPQAGQWGVAAAGKRFPPPE